MIHIKSASILATLFVLVLATSAQAEIATIDEANNVAENWIAQIIHSKGDWGGSDTAHVTAIQEFTRGGRVLGYHCTVEPGGFIVVSLLKELAPVKAHSTVSYLDPESEEGPADLLKSKMAYLLDSVESLVGPIEMVRTEDLEDIVDYHYRPAWDALAISPREFKLTLATSPRNDYQEGGILLTSHWHQGDPYNRACPVGHNGCTDPHCAVGCVATATAQIMRYWCWPPGRDWTLMPDRVSPDSPAPQLNAVAWFCHDVGVAVDTTYCSGDENPCASGAFHVNVPPMLIDSLYDDNVIRLRRDNYEADEWWDGPGMLKDNLNVNRPIQFGIYRHSIVCDGWREWFHGYYLPEYHMNYGWDDGFTQWYELDALYLPAGGAPEGDNMIVNIVPLCSLSSPIFGTYPRVSDYPYRYVDRDCRGGPATFEAGQLVQFLLHMRLKPNTGEFRFYGATGLHTRLYTRGDQTKGILIKGGALAVQPGGVVVLR
ncbi:MAG: C10 family peptidase [Planctomycetota bacterium]